jgi:large subunit ribosomal protein L23
MNNLIKRALVSEKSFMAAGNGKFTFIIDKRADKNQIASVCEKLFKVTVLSVNTMNYNGKVKITKRVKGQRSDFKKVVLTLKPGDKIDLFEIDKAEDKKKDKSAKGEISPIKGGKEDKKVKADKQEKIKK